jgi:hypothetical protein
MSRCLLATSQPRVAEIARPGSNVPLLLAVWIEDGGAGGEGGREGEGRLDKKRSEQLSGPETLTC